MSKHTYFIQCLSGHTSEIHEGHPLFKKCKKRETDGFLDALCVSTDECVECLYQTLHSGKRSLEIYADVAVTDEDFELLKEEGGRLNLLQAKLDQLY